MIEPDLGKINRKQVEQASLRAFAGISNGTGYLTRLFLWHHRRKIFDVLDKEFGTTRRR